MRRFLAVLIGLVCLAGAQEKSKPAQAGVELASRGSCPEAMPLLDQEMRDPANDVAAKRLVSLAGVRCSMLLNQQNDAMSFLGWLQQAYPKDPEVLFLAVHMLSLIHI